MYFTRFGYFVIISIILVAVVAVAAVVYPFGDGDGDGNGTVQVQPTATPEAEPTTAALPSLTFEQVANFAEFGAVVNIEEGPDLIIVNLRPDFDVSGLGTDSHAFTTTLPPGMPNVAAALEAEGLEANGETGVPVIQR